MQSNFFIQSIFRQAKVRPVNLSEKKKIQITTMKAAAVAKTESDSLMNNDKRFFTNYRNTLYGVVYHGPMMELQAQWVLPWVYHGPTIPRTRQAPLAAFGTALR